MPTVTTSHFVLDVPTLFVLTVFISLVGGVLLLFSWMQNRRTPALAMWGAGYIVAASAAAALSSKLIPAAWALCLGNALICAAYGILWSGARSFEGRPVHPILSAAGALIFIAVFQIESVAGSQPSPVVLTSSITAAYTFLSGCELWYARDRELLSRWPTLLLLISHTGFLLARIPLAETLTATFPNKAPSSVVTVMAFEAMFTVFCVPFLRVAMSKERAELEQRRAALTDSLTGIANRRAFFDVGEPLLARTVADRRTAALLLFDLDRFKEVNDTAGHQTGDRMLKTFCKLVAAAMQPGDLFGRIGGEEFACLLPDVVMAEALRRAEQVRRAFEATPFAGLAMRHSVSIGVTATTEAGCDLSALLATADRALYRAKAEGRNRVAPVPPVLVERGAGTGLRWAAEIAVPAVAAPPLAG